MLKQVQHDSNFLVLMFIVFFLCSSSASCYSGIRPENNAYRHNNKGLIYMKEHEFYNAALEFQIAIDLMPKAQGSAAYYVNLAEAYKKLGYTKGVQGCYETALNLNPLYFDYYKKTAEWYKTIGIIDEKTEEYKREKNNPLSKVMLGLLYVQKGETSRGITLLDNFCCEEENLIITPGVRAYLDGLKKNKPSAPAAPAVLSVPNVPALPPLPNV